MTHCPHYPTCGGCAFDSPTAINKSLLLQNALSRAGYANPPLAPLIETPLQTRRRADLAATRHGSTITLGLHKARSNEIVDMHECILLNPNIVALLNPLRNLLRSLETFRRTASVIINLLDQGPDILLRTDATPTGPDRTRIIAFARTQNAVRISIAIDKADPEPIIILTPPIITLAGIPVEPPPGAFLQASPQGEAAIIAAVLKGLPKLTNKSRIAELYAGIGTLTFSLVQHARIEAYEGDPAAIAAHEFSLRKNNLAGRITLSLRDLNRRPLQPAEITGRAAIILDPPYAGAANQIKFLAAAAPPCIIYISCNPEALSNDATALHRAGYTLQSATPIDQFPYSPNLESVMVFGKLK